MEATVSALLNQQINKEFYSAYLYLDIANFYASKGLDGFANWYQVQAKEEQDPCDAVLTVSAQQRPAGDTGGRRQAGRGICFAGGPFGRSAGA